MFSTLWIKSKADEFRVFKPLEYNVVLRKNTALRYTVFSVIYAVISVLIYAYIPELSYILLSLTGGIKYGVGMGNLVLYFSFRSVDKFVSEVLEEKKNLSTI